MCSKDEILTRLNKEEKVSKWLYLFKRSYVYELQNYPTKYQLKEDEKNGLISISPYRFLRIGSVITAFLFIPLILKMYTDNSDDLFFVIFFISLATYAMYYWLKRAFSANLNYSVSVAKEGISIMNSFYEWKQIENIFFIEKSFAKESKTLIIIVSKNCLLERYEISNLNTEKIVSAILYYKNFYQNN